MTWNFDEAVSYYQKQGAPADQTALVQLLREIQQAHGGSIPVWIPERICQRYGIRESLLLAIIKRIPSLRLGNTHTLELCAGPNCGKHTNLAELAEQLSAGGNVTVKFTPCMRMCGKGPNLKFDGKLYHGATEDLLRRLLTDI